MKNFLSKLFKRKKIGVNYEKDVVICAGCGKKLIGTYTCIECKELGMFIELSKEEQQKLMNILMSLLDVKYKYGAEVDMQSNVGDVKQIDCSELSEYAFYKTGIIIPDGSSNQYKASDEFHGIMKIGDLAFMRSRKTQRTSHVGIYIGNDSIIEANGYYGRVVCRHLEEFKRNTKNNEYAGIRRLLKEHINYV